MHNVGEPFDRDVAVALDALDYPVRTASVESIIREARSRSRQRRLRLAAAAVVMLSAAGVAALPGSPARRWLAAAIRGFTSQPSQRPAPPGETVQNSTRTQMRGVSAQIGAFAQISFSSTQDSGDVSLRLISEPELRIRSPEFPSSYSLRAGSITVRNPASRASYDVDVSAAATDIEVIVAGRVVFRRLNGAVVVGPQAKPDGAYVLSLR